MNVKRIYRNCKDSPQEKAIVFAKKHGFLLKREPYGKAGSLIELYWSYKCVGYRQCIGYRKSYPGILNLMKKILIARS